MVSKKRLGSIIALTAVIAFFWGLNFNGTGAEKQAELRSGRYVWDHDKIVVGMDQELIIRPDSGYFLIPEPYLEATWFKIEGDQLRIDDTTVLDYYVTENGIGVIWTPATHQMWTFVE